MLFLTDIKFVVSKTLNLLYNNIISSMLSLTTTIFKKGFF